MLTLVRFIEDDYSTLINWIDSPRLLLQWSGPHFQFPLTHEQLDRYTDGANTIEGKKYIFKCVENNGTTIGHISLDRIDKYNGSARIGKVLIGAQNVRGKGYGEMMIRGILQFAFQELELHKVTLGVFDFNKGAIRCYEKCGFQIEGLLRDHRKFREGEFWSMYEMGILNEEWKETQNELKAATVLL